MKAHLGNQPVQVLGRSKNLIPFPYVTDLEINSAVKVNLDGTIIVNGTSTAGWQIITNNTVMSFEVGKTYTLSGFPAGKGDISYRKIQVEFILVDGSKRTYTSANTSVTFTVQEYKSFTLFLHIAPNQVVDNITIKPMIELGTTATEYEPYIRRFNFHSPVNLIKMPYYDGLSKTQNGITFTVDEETGWVSLSGTYTHTGVTDFRFRRNWYLPAGEYYITGTPKGGNRSYRIIVVLKRTDGSSGFAVDYGDGAKFEIYEGDIIDYLSIRIDQNLGTVNNLVFKPELIKLLGD